MNIPQLIGKECLVLSDEYNHASIILGLRLTGTKIAVFKHNDMKSLENVLRKNIIQGNPKTKKPWKKVCILLFCCVLTWWNYVFQNVQDCANSITRFLHHTLHPT